MKCLYLSEDAVRELLRPEDAYDAVHRAFIDLSSGAAVNVVRTRARTSTMSLHTMSAASPELKLACTKVYSATRTSVSALLLVYDLESGRLVAQLEANELGRARTAAAAAVAAATLLEPQTLDIAIIGAGYQAEGVVRAFTSAKSPVRPRTIYAYRRDTAKLREFVASTAKHCTCAVESTGSAEEAVKRSHLVVSVTSSSVPVIDERWLSEVKHVSGLGSNALSRHELSAKTITGAALCTVDSIAAAEREGGSLLPAIESGKIHWGEIREIGAILHSSETMRPTKAASGYSVFVSHGLAVQDLYTAESVLRRHGVTYGR